MPSLIGEFDLTVALATRGVGFAALGAAYLVLLATFVLSVAAYLAARAYLVISPNRSARDYGIYVSVVLATLLIATVLENELLPAGSATLQYVALPEIVLLVALHMWIAYQQEPWRVALGGAVTAATIVTVIIAGALTDIVRPAHWVVVSALAALLVLLWRKSVSTKRGFVTASSIYIGSKETLDAVTTPQKPWLGLAQWVALLAASVALAIGNSLLRGSGILQIPAVDVALESALLMATTALVCAVPAVSYWLARKAWLPELTRLVWLVWIVVSFAFTYGNYLNSLNAV